MTLGHKDTIPEINDWLGAYLYRTVEDLAASNCQYSPKRDLARAELHGERLEKVIDPASMSVTFSVVHDAPVADQINNQILPELRKLNIQSAKARVLQQVDSMPSSKVQERVSDVISYIHWLKARGCTINPGDEAFLRLNIEEQETLGRVVMKLVVEICFPQLRRLFLVALNWLRRGKLSVEKYPLLPEVCRFLPWRATLDILPLASNPTVTSNLLCPENKAVVEDREAIHDWGGDHDKAFQILDGALRADLQQRLNFKGWHIPQARYRGIDREIDCWEKPLNDEPELLQIGEYHGLRWSRKKRLPELLEKGATGELRNTFIKIAVNTLLGEIRKENRRRGINVPPDWSYAEKTEDEIRKRVDKDIIALAGREVLDYKIEQKGSVTSKLEQATGERSFKDWGWYEDEEEIDRKLYAKQRIAELVQGTKLTPRLKLVTRLYDKSDKVIALALSKRFGKRFKPEAVRALRHDLLQKLREAASEK